MTELDWGLGEFASVAEHAGLLPKVWTLAGQVRQRNADRFESKLGDDAMARAFTTFRNIANLLEDAYKDSPEIKVSRPENSLEVGLSDWLVGVYGLKTSDPMGIRWNGSLRKLELAEANSSVVGEGDQPTLDEAMADAGIPTGDASLKPRHVVIVHWADLEARGLRLWFGFPRDNTRGGAPWLELREYQPKFGGGGKEDAPVPAQPRSPTFRDGKAVELDIKMKPSGDPDALPGAQGA